MKKILSTILSLTAIAAVCGAVLALVDGTTRDAIAQTREKAALAAAAAVMPSGVVETGKNVFKDGAGAETVIYTGYDAAGRPAGYALAGSDPGGYGGDIVLMAGFEADARTVVSYKKLVATETPGLGMNLASPEFSAQFAGKDARGLKVKKDGGEIEAITAATITSRAVCRAIGDAQKKLAAALAGAGKPPADKR